MTVGDLTEVVVEAYNLDGYVADRLEFTYKTFVGTIGNTTSKALANEFQVSDYEYRPSPDTNTVRLTIDMVDICVRQKHGDTVEVDVSCDSAFMLSAMDEVGTAMRTAFHWVPPTEEIFLVMDNAGGHGTEEAIQEYTRILKEKYNIKIIHQCPRSPETNVLDLGIWCTLQLAIDKMMRGRRGELDSLVKGVMDTWLSVDLTSQFASVWGRLQQVLCLIVEDNGGNTLVERKRGKKFQGLNLESIIAQPVAVEDAEVEDLVEAMEEEDDDDT